MIWEIYSYWNITELSGVFEAIAMLTNNDDYSTLMGAALIFGLAGAAIAVLTGVQDLLAGFRWFVMALILYFVLFVPKASVAIVDRTGTEVPKMVSNVPLSIAVFGHVSSKIGDWLTTSYETTMQVITPNYAKEYGVTFGGNGLLFGEKILMEAENARSNNIAFRTNMTAFFEKCVFPEFDRSQGNIIISEVLQTNDVWAAIANVNPSLFVQLYNVDTGIAYDEPTSCDKAYATVIPATIASASTEVLKRMSGKLYPTQEDTVAMASMASSLSGSYSYYLNTAEDSVAIIKQKILSNSFFDAAADSATVTASAMTEAGARLNYGVLYNVAQNTIPKLRNVIEVILYAVFPITLLMMIVAGTKAIGVIKAYFIGLLWIQLWAPLYAVMNYLVSSYNAKELMARVNAGAETSAWNSAEIQAQILGSADVAGMMAMAIPMIAYAIVKGGDMAMTSFVSGATRPVESNAGMSAREVSQGNISMGNPSLDNKSVSNMNAFKYDMQPSANLGPSVRMDDSGNKITTTGSGEQFLDASARMNKSPFHNFQQASSMREGYSQAYETSTKAAHKAYASAGMETGSSFGSSGLISKAAAGGTEWGQAFGNKYSQGTQDTFQKMEGISQSLQSDFGLDQRQASELVGAIAGSVKGGVSLESGAVAGVTGSLSKKYGEGAVAAAMKGLSSIDKNDLSSAANIMAETSESDSIQKSLRLSDDSRSELKAGNQRSESYKTEQKAELERATSAKEGMSRAEEKIYQAMVDIGAATSFDKMTERGKAFATGEGSALLGKAMEARNNGDERLAQSYTAEFDRRVAEYASQYGAPTTSNVGTVKGVGEVSKANQDHINDVNKASSGFKKEIDPTVGKTMGAVQDNMDGVSGKMGVEKAWNKAEREFEKEIFDDRSTVVQAGYGAGTGDLKADPQVKNLSGVSMSDNGTLVNSNLQTARVAEAGVRDLGQTFEAITGKDSTISRAANKMLGQMMNGGNSQSEVMDQQRGIMVAESLKDSGIYQDNKLTSDKLDITKLAASIQDGTYSKGELRSFMDNYGGLDDAQRTQMGTVLNASQSPPGVADNYQSTLEKSLNQNLHGSFATNEQLGLPARDWDAIPAANTGTGVKLPEVPARPASDGGSSSSSR